MPLINANGCDLYYEMEGQGRDMIFIHGEIHGLDPGRQPGNDRSSSIW
jgi:hypothetical protein